MRLEKNLKAYALFGRDKNGKIYGYVEHSFSMGMSATEVRRWPIMSYGMKFRKELKPFEIKDLREYQNKTIAMLERDAKKMKASYPHLEFFVSRLNSAKCPVIIDWKSFKTASGKYNLRNVGFKQK